MGAFWSPTKYKTKSVQHQFGKGLNSFLSPFEIDDNELTDVLNMNSDEFPSIKTREGRSNYGNAFSSTNLFGMGQRNNENIHVVDNETWKYWHEPSATFSNVSTELNGGEAKFVEFAISTSLHTLLMNGVDKLDWDGATLKSMSTNCPQSNLITTHKNRVYVAFEKVLSFSALSKTTDWTTINDSGKITVANAKGDIQALKEYADHVILWTPYGMHELYGTQPNDFVLQDVSNEIGCISDKSVAEVKGRLYWLDYEGLYMYTGGIPQKVSNKVDEWIKDIKLSLKSKICAGVHGDKYYLSIPTGATAITNNKLLVYDTSKFTWFIEDSDIINFVTVGNVLYGLRATGQMVNMIDGIDDGGSPIEWSFTTKPFNENSIESKKAFHSMDFVYKGSTDSTLNISYSTSVDSTTFNTIATTTDFKMTGSEENIRIFTGMDKLQNVDWYRLKLNGTGPMTIHYIQKNLRIKKRSF